MEALEGTLKTPLGAVQKKTALIIGGGAVIVFGIAWYRSRNAQPDALASGSEDINPATGYPYGSPEDLAALAALSTPRPGGGGGGPSSAYPQDIQTGFTNNAQWVQAAIEYMIDHDIVTNPGPLSSALGKYISGQYVTDTDVNLIQQAIAIQGFPPVAGPKGYPPSLNRQPAPPPVKTTPPPVKTTPPSTKPPGNIGFPVAPPSKPAPVLKPPPTLTLPKRRYGLAHRYTNGSDPYSYLGGIARMTGRSTAQLASWNGISNVNLILYAQKIYVDPPGKYSGEVKIF